MFFLTHRVIPWVKELGVVPMRFLKLKEVMEKTALSRSAIYRKMSEDAFPKSVNLGDRAVAWIESEVDEWMKRVIETR
ncbi:AlpA family phage regulatory protein [Vibrio harveyi]|nr:AlpA family phage regulatory protein [Vibrio harveyi]